MTGTTTPAATLNAPALRAWLASSSDQATTPPPHQTWIDFLRVDTALGRDDLAGLAASLLMWADLAGAVTTCHAVESLQVITTRDGDARVEVALATGVVLANEVPNLRGAVGYRTGADAAKALLEAVFTAANEAVALYAVAPVEV